MATVQSNLLKLALAICPTTKDGQIIQGSSSAFTIATASSANPSIITSTTAHGLRTGDKVYISGVSTNTAVNNTLANPNWTVTVTSPTTFTVPILGNGSGTGGTGVGALIGSVDASGFPKQRLLDIYNQARYALFDAMKSKFDPYTLGQEIGALLVSLTNFQFTLTSSVSVATKPTGYLDFISLSNASDVPIYLLDQRYIPVVRQGTNHHYTQSVTNMFVFDIGTQFVHYGTYVTSLSTYKLVYYGITDFILTDVIGNTVTETFNDKYQSILLQLSEAISSEVSTQEINALATKLLG